MFLSRFSHKIHVISLITSHKRGCCRGFLRNFSDFYYLPNHRARVWHYNPFPLKPDGLVMHAFDWNTRVHDTSFQRVLDPLWHEAQSWDQNFVDIGQWLWIDRRVHCPRVRNRSELKAREYRSDIWLDLVSLYKKPITVIFQTKKINVCNKRALEACRMAERVKASTLKPWGWGFESAVL